MRKDAAKTDDGPHQPGYIVTFNLHDVDSTEADSNVLTYVVCEDRLEKGKVMGRLSYRISSKQGIM